MSLTSRTINECNEFQAFIAIPLFICAIVGLPFYIWNYKQFDTEKNVNLLCKFYDEKKEQNPPLDSWKTPFKYTRTDSSNLITYEVRSAGKDKIFDTGDDIFARNQHYKSVSRVVGKKTKEVAKGFIKGLFD